MSANGNKESTGEICHSYILVVNAIALLLHNKTPIYSAWGLLRVCAACPTLRLNQSYELRPPWEQHLRYVPHRVRNGYGRCLSDLSGVSTCRVHQKITADWTEVIEQLKECSCICVVTDSFHPAVCLVGNLRSFCWYPRHGAICFIPKSVRQQTIRALVHDVLAFMQTRVLFTSFAGTWYGSPYVK